MSSNTPSGDLTIIDTPTALGGSSAKLTTASVTNELPARGGSSGETVEEIRRKAKAFFATQNRCVTQEDYEAKILGVPAKFGNVAKVFTQRTAPGEFSMDPSTVYDMTVVTDALEIEITDFTNNRDSNISTNTIINAIIAGAQSDEGSSDWILTEQNKNEKKGEYLSHLRDVFGPSAIFWKEHRYSSFHDKQ